MATIRRSKSEMVSTMGGGAALVDALTSLRDAGIIDGYRLTKYFVFIEGDSTALELAVGRFDDTGLPETHPVDQRAPAPLQELSSLVPSVLRDEWRTKLVDSGFEDIERRDGTLERTVPGSFFSARKGVDENVNARKWSDAAATADYFRIATIWKQSHAYRALPERERLMWRLHCEGKSYRQIAREMQMVRHATVFNIINKCRRLAGLNPQGA